MKIHIIIFLKTKHNHMHYLTSKKSWPILFSKLLYKMGQDFLDIILVQYVQELLSFMESRDAVCGRSLRVFGHDYIVIDF